MEDNEKLASYEAVRQFLIDGEKLINGGNVPCIINEGTNENETIIYVEHVQHVPSYNLSHDIFKSYNLRNPLWSAYYLLKWDSNDKELIIEIDQHRDIRIRRIKNKKH